MLPVSLNAQVLTTGDTLGKNKQALLGSENHLFVDGVRLNIAYGQYVRGLTDRFDLYLSAGGTNIFRSNQAWIAVGGNLHLFRVEKFSVSLFNNCSLPLNRVKESSTVLLNSAVVVSRSMTKSITLYSGINGLFPIGARSRGVFTPTSRQLNVPAGLAYTRGKWTLFIEGDIGHTKALGVGISWVP